MTDQNAAPSAAPDPTVNLDAPPAQEQDKPEGDKPEGEQKETPKSDGADAGEAREGQPEEDDEDDGDTGAEGEKGLSRSQRRRLQLQRERERADRAERELAAERARRASGAPTTDDEIKAEIDRRVGAPPKQEDFADVFEFEAHRAAYIADRRAVEREVRRDAEATKASREAARGQVMRDHNERVEAFKAEVKDFDEVVAKAGHVEARPHVEELIVTSPDSGRLLYHLLKNPAEVAKLNRMSERDAIREIGRIEAKLDRPQPVRTTKAPAPIAGPKGGAAPAPDPSKGPDDMAEYVRWRQSQRG